MIFIILGVEFAFVVRRHSDKMAKENSGLRETRRWKAFLLGKPKDVLANHRDDVNISIGLVVATLRTFAHSCFRIAELSEGFWVHWRTMRSLLT